MNSEKYIISCVYPSLFFIYLIFYSQNLNILYSTFWGNFFVGFFLCVCGLFFISLNSSILHLYLLFVLLLPCCYQQKQSLVQFCLWCRLNDPGILSVPCHSLAFSKIQFCNKITIVYNRKAGIIRLPAICFPSYNMKEQYQT